MRNRTDQSGESTLSIALLLFGLLSVSAAFLPGVAIFRETSVYDIFMGGALFDVTMLVVSAGLLIIGIAAIVLGLLLAVARTT